MFLFYSSLLLLGLSIGLLLLVIPKLVSGCHEEEREALLKFKHGGLQNPENRLSSWGSSGNKDCCSWPGVGCNNSTTTRRVVKLDLRNTNLDEYGRPLLNFSLGGKIDSSLIHLQHLTYLDLSGSNFVNAIPDFFGTFEHLEYLNLSYSNFVGRIPNQLGNLSNLHTLDLGRNFYLTVDDDFAWASSLSSLLYLDLSRVSLSFSELNWLTNFSSLTHLYLSYGGFHGSMPPSMGNLTSLEVLDLSHNSIYGTIPASFSTNLCKLRILNLGYNTNISGIWQRWTGSICLANSLKELYLSGIDMRSSSTVLLSTIGNLTSLEVLDLSHNSIYGTIPASFSTNLCKLRILNLRYNTNISGIWQRWTGSICLANSLQELYLNGIDMRSSSTVLLSTIGNLTSLEVLDLRGNSIYGTLPRSLTSNLCHLRVLRLEGNSIRGMERSIRGLCNSLEELNLRGNQLGGDLQVLWAQISNISRTLKILDLSNNSLTGYIPYSSSNGGTMLPDVLEELYLDGNKLSGNVILQNIAKFSNLVTLSIKQNSLPIVITEDVLIKLERLEGIYLSKNRLVWKVKSRWLPPNIKRIYLSSSQVGPKFPLWLQHHQRGGVSVLAMSNASISDDVPDWFWKITTEMKILDLSHNQLRGYLPSIGMSTWYEILDLSNNSFYGPIPEDLCMLKSLQELRLSNNHFHGDIPDCWGKGGRNLFYINLSYNNLSGEAPRSLGNLPSLAFLHMRNNSISGEISSTTKNMKNLLVLDLAFNRFSRVPIPTWDTAGEDLSKLRILSLRSNMIHGNIPSEISQLSSLQFLDLSHNMLSGVIPISFGKLTGMSRKHNEKDKHFDFETPGFLYFSAIDSIWMNLKGVELENSGTLGFMNHIDLSSNNLSGDIPKELTHLLELVSLNLSGKIPTGFQLQTLNDSSVYVGNDNLCGPPLFRKCLTNDPPNMGKDGEEKRGKEDEIEIIGLFISIALGFVVGFWACCGLLIFKRSWRTWYYRFADEMMDKVFVTVAVRVGRLKRKFNKSAEI
ncbi:hypothetical protein H6P81_017656 [Aristolochia fimbriata]|uniref:Leucine-rich repeat-containing N-terminal plant-type domain-containing protein n=1 Tax=Aristolochia fimbriata TaxID=158543 RepID=A0AAV7DZB4_ARIFI|nr:hypothetical protein H6P81_017656 [Aristolochia fimbriata]